MDQVRPRQRDMQSTGLVDQIHPRYPNPPKIIFRCCCQVDISFFLFFSDNRSKKDLIDMINAMEIADKTCQIDKVYSYWPDYYPH